MQQKLKVIRDGQMFGVKVTYYSGRTEVARGFATQEEAEAWIDKDSGGSLL